MSSSPGAGKSSHAGKKRAHQPSSMDAPVAAAKSSSSSNSNSNKRAKTSSSNSQNVRVVARLRPLSTKEITESSKEAITAVPSTNGAECATTVAVDTSNAARGNSQTPRTFDYDGAFGPSTSQQALYEHTVGGLVRSNVFKGFNVTIMAYGQTGSGKTFTMGTEGTPLRDDATTASTAPPPPTSNELQAPSPSDGIIPRAVYDLFDQRRLMPQGEQRVSIELSYLEIYNEEVRDLLLHADAAKAPLVIRDGRDGAVMVQNLSTRVVTRPQDVSALMNQAATKRATASTAMNAVSSRSHAICTLHVTIAPSTSATTTSTSTTSTSDECTTTTTRAKLTLVDLAGSERIKRTGAEGKRMKEGISINKGLFVLGQCVSALSELGQKGLSAAAANSHIPYRDSKLTRLLQDSLGGNSKTILVACISPADTNVEESTNTLRYAARTRNIQNTAVRNTAPTAPISATEAAALRKENATLKLQLAQAQERASLLLEQQQQKSNKSADDAALKPAALSLSNNKNSNVLSIVTTNLEEQPPQSVLDAAAEVQPKQPIVVGGIDVSKLDRLYRLQSTISSLESQLQQVQEQQFNAVADSLESSIRADQWQLRYEQLAAVAKAQGVALPEDNSNDAGDSVDIVSRLRQQVTNLKAELHEAFVEIAVARAIAASVVSGNGDLAQDLALTAAADDAAGADYNTTPTSSPSSSDDSMDADNDDKEELLALTAELVAMSGGIEAKEAMAIQMNKEASVMAAMRIHFENAVQSLQEEVEVLSTERACLLTKTSNNGTNRNDSEDTKRKIFKLEGRIKGLQKKAAEHTRSLRLREAAEKKCARLASDIQADKKRRVTLQKQLKEQSSERRSDKLAAKKEATRLLRDSDALKRELQKVKDAASKMAAVLRRKAEAALNRQKRESALQAKKRQHQEDRKRLAAVRENTKNKQGQSPPASPESVCDDRKDVLLWLENEIEYAELLGDMHGKIKHQKRLLELAKTAKMDMDIAADPALAEEIEMRILSLEQSVKTLFKNSWTSPKAKSMASSSSFMDASLYEGLSKSEAKAVFSSCFNRLLLLKKQIVAAESNREHSTSRAVNAALAKERRLTEKINHQLKLDHSQSMMDLLNSTNASIEHSVSVRLNSLNSVVDPDFQATVEEMLSGYLEGCSKANKTVQGELREVKEAQEGMKQMVESVATGMIGVQSGVGTPPKKKSKKKQAKKKRTSTDSILEEIELLEADDADEDNSDDSDWSPSRNKTPGPKRRSRKSADSVSKENGSESKKSVEFASEAVKLDETMETVQEDNDLSMDVKDASVADTSESSEPAQDVNNEQAGVGVVNYEKLKVKQLRELLKARNLGVSGLKKSALISRLQENDGEGPGRSEFVDLTQEDSEDENTSNRRTSNRRLARGRRGLQNRDINDKGKALPATPPQSTQKLGGGWSTKKIASVRRSTMFSARKRSPSPEPETDSPAADKSNKGNSNNQENENMAGASEGAESSRRLRSKKSASTRRNLGAQLADNSSIMDNVNSVNNRALAQLNSNIA